LNSIKSVASILLSADHEHRGVAGANPGILSDTSERFFPVMMPSRLAVLGLYGLLFSGATWLRSGSKLQKALADFVECIDEAPCAFSTPCLIMGTQMRMMHSACAPHIFTREVHR
jgi:hypothetical protein